MADILVKHNQAENDLQSWSNLKARHMGFSEEANGFWFKKADGSEDGLPVLVPTTIGQGMGRRYAQAGHGFTVKQLIRWTGTAWTLALATDDASTLATHMVVRVVDADEFDVARMGAWTLGGSPNGDLYLSATLAGSTTTTKPANPALVQRVAVGDGLAYHLTFDLPSGSAAYLPLSGGTMGGSAQIQYEENADAYQAGMYWGGPNWARLSRWGLIWNRTETRSGFQLYPVVGGGSYFGLQRRNSFENDVELYGHGDGGYMNLKGATGRNAVSLGAEPGSGHGSLYLQNGAGQWTLSHSSSANAQYSVTNLRTVNAATELQVAYATRIDNLGRGFFTNATISSIANGSIPLAGVDGLLGNSSLSEDAASVKSAKPLTLNGAARPAWGFNALQLDTLSAIWQSPSATRIGRNVYHDGGNFRAISSGTGTLYPSILYVQNDGMWIIAASQTDPAAGGVVSDMVLRWSVDRFGNQVTAGTFSAEGQQVKRKVFGCIYLNGEGSTAQNIPTGATYTKITPFTTNMAGSLVATPDYTGAQITVNRTGLFTVGFSRSYQVGTANVVWHVAAFVNGVIQPQTILSVKSTSTNTLVYADLDIPVAANSGDTIDIRIRHDNGGTVAITYEHACLSITSID